MIRVSGELEVSSGSAIGPDPGRESSVRVDRWLWAVRIFKTRSLAADACKAGHVRIAGQPVKCSRQVRAGQRVDVQNVGLVRRYEVLEPIDKRVGAKLVARYVADHTPPEELERWQEEQRQRRLAERESPAGTGRPTKRERRQMEVFLKAIRK